MTLQTGSPVTATGVVAHHRPRYHVRPPQGYLNDPNGPILIDQTAHLYFQSRSTADLSVPVEWGHATSTDFARWQLHRPAIVPVPDGLDGGGCWSGNTVPDGDRIHAFYSGFNSESPYQSVLTAVSSDGGYSFGPPRLAVPDPTPDEQIVTYRDPFVWRQGERWQLVVGVGYADGRAAIRAYESSDLANWTRIDNLAELPRQDLAGEDTGEAWECPQVLELDGGPVAVVGSWNAASGISEALAFRPTAPYAMQRIDHGPNFYAASALQRSPFGPLLFGWVTEGRTEDAWTAAGWAGVISLARQVWWAADGSLRAAPVPSLTSLRSGGPRPADGAVLGAQFEIVVPTAPARVELQFGSAERLCVALDDAAGSLTVDRSAASIDPDAYGGAATAPDAFDPDSDRPAARVFVDGSVIEVFTSAGRVITTRAYPLSPPPWHCVATPGCQAWALE